MNPACGGSSSTSNSSNNSSSRLGSGAFGTGNDRRAREAVDRVFEACFADTAPFDRMP